MYRIVLAAPVLLASLSAAIADPPAPTRTPLHHTIDLAIGETADIGRCFPGEHAGDATPLLITCHPRTIPRPFARPGYFAPFAPVLRGDMACSQTPRSRRP